MEERHPIGQGAAVLLDLLRARGIDPQSAPPIEVVWPVFKEFVAIPFATDGDESDGVLYQSGTYSFTGRRAFHVVFVRQFQVLDGTGEHDHFEQLRCEFLFDPDEKTDGLRPFHLWWFRGRDEPSWPAFVMQVEDRDEVRVLASITPDATLIQQDRV